MAKTEERKGELVPDVEGPKYVYPMQQCPMTIEAVVDKGAVYTTFTEVTDETRFNMYKVLRGQVDDAETFVGREFAPKDMVVHPVQWANDKGEEVMAAAVTFVCHDGTLLQIRSAGIWSSVRDLIRLQLCPPWRTDIILRLTRRKCKTDPQKSYYAFDLVGKYVPPKK